MITPEDRGHRTDRNSVTVDYFKTMDIALLRGRGFGPQELARVRCPIGVAKHSKEPNAIAISVAAELLEHVQAGKGA